MSEDKLTAESFLTLAQSAEKLQVSPATMRRYLAAGVVRGVKFGREWRVPVQSLWDIADRITRGVPLDVPVPVNGKRARSNKLALRAREVAE